MPRSITFNGQTLLRPGALSRVQAAPNRRANPLAPGIVALIGEGDAGAQGIYEFTDPLDIPAALYGGDVANAAAYAFDPSNDPIITGGAFKVIVYKVNQSTAASTTLAGDEAVVTASTVAGASTNTVLNYTAANLVVDQHIGRWFKLGTGASAQYRRIVDNAAGTVTVSPGYIGDPASFTALAATVLQNQLALTARRPGTAGNAIRVEFEAAATADKYIFTVSDGVTTEQSPEICGEPYFQLKYLAGPIPANGTGPITSTTGSDTITINVALAPVLNAWTGYVLHLPGGYQRLISTNTALALTTVVLAAGHGLTAAALTAMIGGTATVRAVTAGTCSFGTTAGGGAPTAIVATITSVPPSALDNLSLSFATIGVTTLQEFADYINANTNYEASIPDGINPATPIGQMDYGTNNSGVTVRFDHEAAIIATLRGQFRRDLQTLIDWINNFSSLVSTVRIPGDAGILFGAAEGGELPAVTGGVYGTIGDTTVPLTGGARGTSANSDWQTGFDALLNYRASQIVLLATQDGADDGNSSTYTIAALWAQLAAHIRSANGQYKTERGGFAPRATGFTAAAAAAFPAVFNSRDVQVTNESWEILDVTGNLITKAWAPAVGAAGMRANGLGESLTRKLPRVTSRTSTWDSSSRSTVNTLLQAGVLFTEVTPAGIVRWCRDITTYTNDDLETSIDGQTRDVVRYIAYDLRTFIEDTFTGQRVRNGRDGRPPTIASIRDMAGARLGSYVEQDLLINSLDPEDTSKVVPGFDRLRVTLSGSVLALSVRIFPTTAITFETLDITTEIPLLAA